MPVNRTIGKKISEGRIRNFEKNVLNPFRLRIRRCISHFGNERFLALLFRLSGSPTTWYSFKCYVTRLYKHLRQYMPILNSELHKIYVMFYLMEEYTKKCKYCGKDIGVYLENSSKINPNVYCSKSCASFVMGRDPVISQKRSEAGLKRYKSIQARKETSISSKHSWKTRDKQIWVQKYLTTLGEVGIKLRTKKALDTKLKKGLIAEIRAEPFNPTPYHEYKLLVLKFTRRSGLEGSNKQAHIDHIFPMSKGFIFDVPPELIGDIENLKLIEAQTNRTKSNILTEMPGHIALYLKENNPKALKDIQDEIEAYNQRKI